MAERDYDASASAYDARASYNRQDSDNFVFEIHKSFGVLRKSNIGWTRELCIVSWNGGAPRFDLREWSPDHAHMSKGITFTKEEAIQIAQWIQNADMNALFPSGKKDGGRAGIDGMRDAGSPGRQREGQDRQESPVQMRMAESMPEIPEGYEPADEDVPF